MELNKLKQIFIYISANYQRAEIYDYYMKLLGILFQTIITVFYIVFYSPWVTLRL